MTIHETFWDHPRVVRLSDANVRLLTYILGAHTKNVCPGLLRGGVQHWAEAMRWDVRKTAEVLHSLQSHRWIELDDEHRLLRIPRKPFWILRPNANQMHGWFRIWQGLPRIDLKYRQVPALEEALHGFKWFDEAWAETFANVRRPRVAVHDEIEPASNDAQGAFAFAAPPVRELVGHAETVSDKLLAQENPPLGADPTETLDSVIAEGQTSQKSELDRQFGQLPNSRTISGAKTSFETSSGTSRNSRVCESVAEPEGGGSRGEGQAELVGEVPRRARRLGRKPVDQPPLRALELASHLEAAIKRHTPAGATCTNQLHGWARWIEKLLVKGDKGQVGHSVADIEATIEFAHADSTPPYFKRQAGDGRKLHKNYVDLRMEMNGQSGKRRRTDRGPTPPVVSDFGSEYGFWNDFDEGRTQ